MSKIAGAFGILFLISAATIGLYVIYVLRRRRQNNFMRLGTEFHYIFNNIICVTKILFSINMRLK